MPLALDDGYTLDGQTSGKGDYGEPFPVVGFKYRPPLAQEMATYRFKVQTAATPEQAWKARADFLLARLVSWDVIGKDKKTAKLDEDTLALVPDPVLSDLLIECSKWKSRTQEQSAGNS